jgi:hypothetical protein
MHSLLEVSDVCGGELFAKRASPTNSSRMLNAIFYFSSLRAHKHTYDLRPKSSAMMCFSDEATTLLSHFFPKHFGGASVSVSWLLELASSATSSKSHRERPTTSPLSLPPLFFFACKLICSSSF